MEDIRPAPRFFTLVDAVAYPTKIYEENGALQTIDFIILEPSRVATCIGSYESDCLKKIGAQDGYLSSFKIKIAREGSKESFLEDSSIFNQKQKSTFVGQGSIQVKLWGQYEFGWNNQDLTKSFNEEMGKTANTNEVLTLAKSLFKKYPPTKRKSTKELSDSVWEIVLDKKLCMKVRLAQLWWPDGSMMADKEYIKFFLTADVVSLQSASLQAKGAKIEENSRINKKK